MGPPPVQRPPSNNFGTNGIMNKRDTKVEEKGLPHIGSNKMIPIKSDSESDSEDKIEILNVK